MATLTPERAQLALVQAQHDQRISNLRAQNNDLKKLADQKDQQIALMSRGLRAKVGTGVSTALTLGSAYMAGIGDGYLKAKGSDKVGPVKAVSVVGLALAVAGVVIEDPDIAEGASALGRGFASGPAYQLGYEFGQKKGTAAPAQESAQPATKK